MEFGTSFWMMFAFIIFMILGVWKIWAFLPTKRLADDDTTQASQKELLKLVLSNIRKNKGNLSEAELFQAIEKSDKFDAKHYWRFNQNKLKQLLQKYYVQHPESSSIADIYKNL